MRALNATVSKPPAANVGSVKVMASLLADEKVNALFSMTGSLAGALTVGGLLAVLVTVREVLADADNPLLIFVILTVERISAHEIRGGCIAQAVQRLDQIGKGPLDGHRRRVVRPGDHGD